MNEYLNLSPEDFNLFLLEESQYRSPAEIDDLRRQYRDANSFAGMIKRALPPEEGRRRSTFLPVDAPQGMSIWDAITSGEASPAIPQGIVDLLSGGARAVESPAEYAQGIPPRADAMGDAANLAGMLMLGGGAVAKPAGALASNMVRYDSPAGGFDKYLSRVNPKRKRIAAESRPNLMMGDMHGVMPRGSKPVGKKGNVTFYRDGDGNYYATAYSPDLGGQDVVGYVFNRGNMTDLHVVEEMQGQGIGSELQYLYRRENPDAPTGGLTEAGEKSLKRTYDRLFDEGIVAANASKSAGALTVAADIDALFKVDKPDIIKDMLRDDEYAADVLGSLRNKSSDIADAANAADVQAVRDELYRRTQEMLADMPDEITVYRAGSLNEGDGVSSFTLNPDYNPNTQLPWNDLRGSPSLEAYTVKKSDILATPDLIRNFGEGEIIIPNSAVRKGKSDVAERGDTLIGMLKSGRAAEVTDDMLDMGDSVKNTQLNQYLFQNYDLPMDEASRMARAREMGFDTSAYHGSNKDFQSFDPEMADDRTYGTGTWVSDNPDVAATYTGSIYDDPQTYPVEINAKDFGSVDWRGAAWGDGPEYGYMRYPKNSDRFSDKIKDIYEDWDFWASSDNAARAAGQQGLSGVALNDIIDIGPNIFSRADTQKRLPETSTSTAVLDPSKARSRFARFDPRLSHLSNLTAANASPLGGLVAQGMVSQEELEDYLRQKGVQ